MLPERNLEWWLWTASAILIGIGLSGYVFGFYLLILLSLFQVTYFTIEERSYTAFPVQVRIAFLILSVIFFWEPMRWLYWWPMIGLTVRVTTDYCLLARTLSLLPWNRQEPLTGDLIRRTILSKPVKGCILKYR